MAELTAYIAARNITITGGSSAVYEANLRYSTEWLDANYRWKGLKAKSTQALEWPRLGVIDSDGFYVTDYSIPAKLKQATIEVAVALSQGAVLDSRPDDSPSPIREKVKAGPVESETQYGSSTRSRFTRIDGLLAKLVHVPSLLVGYAVRY